MYDGEGNRAKAIVSGVIIVYVGNYYEQTGSTIRKYPSTPLRASYTANGSGWAAARSTTC